MKRLDQGHLHPKQEVSRLTCPGREPFDQLVNSYSGIGTSKYERATSGECSRQNIMYNKKQE